MRPLIIQGDAARLPLPDDSVDIVITSPPYWQLRDYRSDGESLEGQLGREPTWQGYIDSLVECTRDWVRVLKPTGSIFVNIGDKYGRGSRTNYGPKGDGVSKNIGKPDSCVATGNGKSLFGLPWRYAFAVQDALGLVIRAEIIWCKKNGLPESVRDRVNRKHEQVFHFTLQDDYYAATDLIREPQSEEWLAAAQRGGKRSYRGAEASEPGDKTGRPGGFNWAGSEISAHPMGALPRSWWDIPIAPLQVPFWWEGDEHYAAFPPALPKKIITGWCPPAICTACGQGLFPVVQRATTGRDNNQAERKSQRVCGFSSQEWQRVKAQAGGDQILGFACGCTPYTEHKGRAKGGTDRSLGQRYAAETGRAGHLHGGVGALSGEPARAWREYHFADWEPAPTRPAVVLDPFGGTGTTAMVAAALGRRGITVDLSSGYCDFARWRANDSGEQAAVRGEKRLPVAQRLREDLYGGLGDELDALIEEAQRSE